jgi:hypothetical protein
VVTHRAYPVDEIGDILIPGSSSLCEVVHWFRKCSSVCNHRQGKRDCCRETHLGFWNRLKVRNSNLKSIWCNNWDTYTAVMKEKSMLLKLSHERGTSHDEGTGWRMQRPKEM